MSRATERCEMVKPSLRSSPWIRGAPQSGLARAIFPIRSFSSESIGGRPGPRHFDFQVQKARNPWRCQRITVSGRTKCRTSRQRNQRRKGGPRRAGRTFRTAAAWSAGAGGRAAAEVQGSLVPDSYALAGPSGASLAGQPRWTTWRGSVVPLADYRQVTRSNSGQRQAAILGVARRTLQRQEREQD